jgi:hypothetical protein
VHRGSQPFVHLPYGNRRKTLAEHNLSAHVPGPVCRSPNVVRVMAREAKQPMDLLGSDHKMNELVEGVVFDGNVLHEPNRSLPSLSAS